MEGKDGEEMTGMTVWLGKGGVFSEKEPLMLADRRICQFFQDLPPAGGVGVVELVALVGRALATQ